MIGLDANIILRYIAQDDEVQSPKATSRIEQLSESRPGFISLVVIVEIAWTLRSFYRLNDAAIATTIERLLQASAFVVQDEQQVFYAIAIAKDGRASLADALIGALGSKAGCDHTLTFDRKAARLPEFELL